MNCSKNYHFISGMPRSGSTLLCCILNQNPRFHASNTSGILDIIFSVRNQWGNTVEFQANKNEEAKRRVLFGILESFYSNIDKPVIFDKSRGWLPYIEMAEILLGREIKILVPVRDMRDILASFEKLYRNTIPTHQVDNERENYFDWQTVDGRCKILTNKDQPVGLAYNRIKDALQRGFDNRMMFVHYEHLTVSPKRAMQSVYEFLDEDYYEHDFDNVEQTVTEIDKVYGFGDGLHSIRQQVKPQQSQWLEILGMQVASKYQGTELW